MTIETMPGGEAQRQKRIELLKQLIKAAEFAGEHPELFVGISLAVRRNARADFETRARESLNHSKPTSKEDLQQTKNFALIFTALNLFVDVNFDEGLEDALKQAKILLRGLQNQFTDQLRDLERGIILPGEA